jgi:hypothetical protein
VTFMHYDLGFFDHEAGRVECADNPFDPRVLPMSPVQNVTYVTGIDRREMVARGGIEPPTRGFSVSGSLEILVPRPKILKGFFVGTRAWLSQPNLFRTRTPKSGLI